jgi:hypothetical protein
VVCIIFLTEGISMPFYPGPAKDKEQPDSPCQKWFKGDFLKVFQHDNCLLNQLILSGTEFAF